MPNALLLPERDVRSIGRVQRLKLGGSTDKHLTEAFDRSPSVVSVFFALFLVADLGCLRKPERYATEYCTTLVKAPRVVESYGQRFPDCRSVE